MNPAGAARQRDAPPLVRLGKYELLSRLGIGGMAELFVARITAAHGFEKRVALKRILASHADDEQFIEMLLGEARLAATLDHPNIVQVYDVGEVDGTYFFTMEYVFGSDLRKIVRACQTRGTWPGPELVLQIIIGTATGLHYAHEKEREDGELLGLVHRDVSPSNILVSHDGGVKLVDFGIARVSAMQSTTAQGVLKGKVPYMSPEQCRGEPLDRRSDIFSLGIILWELSTRRRLFAGDNDVAVAGKICNNDVPRPSSIVPGYPPELEEIVLKALARDPALRYATAQELQLDLEEYARDARMLLSSARLAGFMGDLFADEIKATKADIRQQIATRPDIIAIGDDSDAGARRSNSHKLPPPPGIANPVREATSTNHHTGVEGPAPRPNRRRWLGLTGAGALLLLLALALGRGQPGTEAQAPTAAPAAPEAVLPPPAPLPLVTPPTPPVTPPVTPIITPPVDVSEPAPTDAPDKPARPTKKRVVKPKKPSNWDPDSPLPPP